LVPGRSAPSSGVRPAQSLKLSRSVRLKKPCARGGPALPFSQAIEPDARRATLDRRSRLGLSQPRAEGARLSFFKLFFHHIHLPELLPMSRIERVLSKLPDCEEALRRLADVLQMPAACRKRACRREGRCQGGYGPPWYFEKRDVFADSIREGMRDHRDYWDRQRESLRTLLRR
jgi:hypothetical protein